MIYSDIECLNKATHYWSSGNRYQSDTDHCLLRLTTVDRGNRYQSDTDVFWDLLLQKVVSFHTGKDDFQSDLLLWTVVCQSFSEAIAPNWRHDHLQ
jgi:hypothetical protein